MLRNKNIDPVSAKNMSYRPELKHLTVIGFTNNTSNTELAKKGITKLQKAKANIVDAGSDLSGAFKLTIEQFKADVVIKINETEHKIADFKKKTSGSSNEIAAIYQPQMDQLEASKTKLLLALETYKEDGESEWKLFKHQFGKDLKKFEKEIGGFIKNFGNQ